jgi:uncharacterized alkaline shock family protein YloU
MSKKNEHSTESKIPTISEDSNTLGEIHINHSVVASIVRLAALEVPGVAEVCSGSGFVDGITEIFSKKSDERGIQIDKDEVGDYKIRIRVILYFGVELAAVGNEIQQRIAEQVEKMTSKSVASVDIIIDEVRTSEQSSKKSHWDEHEELS